MGLTSNEQAEFLHIWSSFQRSQHSSLAMDGSVLIKVRASAQAQAPDLWVGGVGVGVVWDHSSGSHISLQTPGPAESGNLPKALPAICGNSEERGSENPLIQGCRNCGTPPWFSEGFHSSLHPCSPWRTNESSKYQYSHQGAISHYKTDSYCFEGPQRSPFIDLPGNCQVSRYEECLGWWADVIV